MKRTVISLSLATALLAGCQSYEPSNSMPKSPGLPPPPFTPSSEPDAPEAETFSEEDLIVGGYAPMNNEDEHSVKAKEMVIDAIYKKYPTRALVDKVETQIQVVAGLNYGFKIEMSGPKATRDIFEGVVYRDLEDNFELTSLSQLQGQ